MEIVLLKTKVALCLTLVLAAAVVAGGGAERDGHPGQPAGARDGHRAAADGRCMMMIKRWLLAAALAALSLAGLARFAPPPPKGAKDLKATAFTGFPPLEGEAVAKRRQGAVLFIPQQKSPTFQVGKQGFFLKI